MHLAQSLATLRLDPASRVPMFRQLYEAIKQTILSGRVNPGMQLPPTRELSQLFGISRQTVLADFIAEGNFGRHIKRTREVYAERRSVLLDALETHCAEEFQAGPADAGLQLSVTFRRKRNDQTVSRAALQKGIEVRALSRFYNVEDSAAIKQASGLVLGFASIPVAEIRCGVMILRDVLQG